MNLRSLFTPKWQQPVVELDLPLPNKKNDPIGFQVAIAKMPKRIKGESDQSYAQTIRAWELAQRNNS
jgi:hypothetical protein